ncbi:DeoR/GlpR family DNA-binding transcription regulator [Tuberibacillus sp. Marseille-P3662]|uniref:DeoR/GlpR family DNA-binding transcription regulator n=1 Tax=Tuberibacillus sp. Marseille-P3662 TaxID=1965358 RepID=UPI000A1C886F|nr:DeoR/GlpR family DNA-binding transcription regulator [Tuberibacillus sp. Marseille-P3662]
MLQIERQQKILSRIEENGKGEIDTLAKDLKVSAMTIRRDLAALEKEGKLIRSHGGAVSTERLIPETSYHNKMSKHTEHKRNIARHAAELIPKNAQIILDSGTTTLEIARLIKRRADLVIVTNDVKISIELIDSKSRVICTGGDLQPNIGSFLGPHVKTMLEQIEVDMLFLGAHAINTKSGISAPTMDKANVKKLMIKAAQQIWVVADHSKFDQRAFANVCSLDTTDGVITDDNLPTEKRKEYENIVTIEYR